ncbi:hypothetical protein EXIGLDRAFT_723110 [Exidia glandulosa HHB12029]|uniref:F-box domain-containing protein n=1 Tax=Exidia glandulosa HHB12029 TaxID=1314781 RepID=A0A165EYY0_EXIGL|nr:hypothetical protein EXIGLDRAFT_723110 [Exidia glandulosa HHB12029]
MASPTATFCTMEATPSLPCFDYQRFLLPELILCIFDQLPHRDLLSAAGACSRWRYLALKHPNFAYHVALVVDVKHPASCQRLTAFCAVLRCARQRKVDVCVSVDWRPAAAAVTTDPATGALVLHADTEQNKKPVHAMRTIMAAIRDSLRRIIELELTFGAVHRQTLWEDIFFKLEAPMPRLQEFTFKVGLPQELYDEHHTYLPLRLFARNAPKLWRVTIAGIELNNRPIDAFSKASVVDVATVNTDFDLHALFPNLCELTVRVTPVKVVAMSLCFTWTLDRLKTVVVSRTPIYLADTQQICQVPQTFVTFDVSGLLGNVSLVLFVKPIPSTVVLRLGRIVDSLDPTGSCAVVTIASHNSNTVREFGLRGCTDAELHTILLANLRLFGPRIVAVYAQDCFIDVLPDIFDTLPELEVLNVEWPAIPTPALRRNWHKRVYCPKLRQVNLFDLSSRVEANANVERLRDVIWPGERPSW